MSTCPQCSQPVSSTALECPHCHRALKAFGHPGIPLYRATGDQFLCDTCLYHQDDTCDYPQRPQARDCTLYHNKAEPLVPAPPTYQPPDWTQQLQSWIQGFFNG